ncbi:MAG: hypothetical protein L3J83_01940 [Proteobacteria bacterium]|nr:hypothetical protein [Pseudomonadota bacterium]
MSTMIKTLEEIGQSASLKQFDSSIHLLSSMNISDSIIQDLQKHTIEYVCAILPEDDDDDDDDDDDEINI